MENASKALIIAGAILLAILIISLGIMIFNQAQEATKNGGMTKAEVSTYNAQYTKYEGIQSGTNVKSLIQEIKANNAIDKSNGSTREAQIDGDITLNSTVSSTSKYTVTITEYDDSGYVKKINVKAVKKEQE